MSCSLRSRVPCRGSRAILPEPLALCGEPTIHTLPHCTASSQAPEHRKGLSAVLAGCRCGEPLCKPASGQLVLRTFLQQQQQPWISGYPEPEPPEALSVRLSDDSTRPPRCTGAYPSPASDYVAVTNERVRRGAHPGLTGAMRHTRSDIGMRRGQS